MTKFENYDPSVKVSGTENAEKKAKDILSGLKKGITESLMDKIADLKDQYLLDIHNLHETYYPKFNTLTERYWKKTTGIAATAYKKIEKYAPQMYNDCMKHTMLISDENIRDTLEGELISKLTGYIKMGLKNAVNGYKASPLDIDECGCDKKDLAAIKERKEKESEKLANEAIKKAM